MGEPKHGPVRWLDRLKLVPARFSHKPFIRSSWIHSVSEQMDRAVKRPLLNDEEARAIDRSFHLCQSLIDPDEPEVVHAWICGRRGDDDRPGLLHWAFVPLELRRKKIFTLMTAVVCGQDPVHYTRNCKFVRFPRNYMYNPYRIGDV